MSSRKLLAHDFIKRYFARWGKSPSLSEVASALGVTRTHAHRLIRELSDERQITIVAGKARGIRLPDRKDEISEADALAQLKALGYTIDEQLLTPPPSAPDLSNVYPLLDHPDVTKSGLPELDHILHHADAPPHTNPGAPEGDIGGSKTESGARRRQNGVAARR